MELEGQSIQVSLQAEGQPIQVQQWSPQKGSDNNLRVKPYKCTFIVLLAHYWANLSPLLFFTHVIISERNRRLEPMAYMAIVSHGLPMHSITCTALLSCSCCLVDFASGECSVGHSKIKFQYGKTYQQKCTKRRPS